MANRSWPSPETASAMTVCTTHSPILMAYPEATIYLLDPTGMKPVGYEETEHVQITRSFLNGRESYLKHLLEEDSE